MSREIKFRALDKISKPNRIKTWGQLQAQYNNISQVFNSEGFELMQYIGRRDISDKEIYEGDIVKVNDKLYEVIFDESFLGFNLKNYFDSSSDYLKIAFSELNNIEVIGNIYEDTELLKEVQ